MQGFSGVSMNLLGVENNRILTAGKSEIRTIVFAKINDITPENPPLGFRELLNKGGAQGPALVLVSGREFAQNTNSSVTREREPSRQ
jgi:hypothetical protein